MIYKFNGKDITAYGVLPARDEGGVAVNGLFDFPKRTGDMERNWGDRVEPHVSAEDLEFGERTIGLKLVMEDLANLEGFREACLGCRSLETELGDFDVVMAEEIKVEKVGEKLGLIDVRFKQDRVDFEPLSLPGTGGSGFRVDGFNLLADFGIAVSGVAGDRDTPKRIEVNTSMPYRNTRYRENATFTLECTMRETNLKAVKEKMGQFHALWVQPGFRVLYFPDGRSRLVYVKEGFSVRIGGDGILMFSLKLEAYDRAI